MAAVSWASYIKLCVIVRALNNWRFWCCSNRCGKNFNDNINIIPTSIENIWLPHISDKRWIVYFLSLVLSLRIYALLIKYSPVQEACTFTFMSHTINIWLLIAHSARYHSHCLNICFKHKKYFNFSLSQIKMWSIVTHKV